MRLLANGMLDAKFLHDHTRVRACIARFPKVQISIFQEFFYEGYCVGRSFGNCRSPLLAPRGYRIKEKAPAIQRTLCLAVVTAG